MDGCCMKDSRKEASVTWRVPGRDHFEQPLLTNVQPSPRQVAMSPEDPHLHQINRIFEEAVVLHGDDVEEIVNYVKARIATAGRRERADMDRIFERVLAFRAPDCLTRPLN